MSAKGSRTSRRSVPEALKGKDYHVAHTLVSLFGWK